MIDRRTVLVGGGGLIAGAYVPLGSGLPARVEAQLRIIEASVGGELGVYMLDTGTGAALVRRIHERFAHCSSFKLSLAALVLALDRAGELDAGQQVPWRREDLLGNSPFTTERLARGASLRELAHAAQTVSDNTAANILLREVGGPGRLTAFWRSLGDSVSRLDRFEFELNHVPRGEVRDTTTPEAMATTVAELLYGATLALDISATLRQWMIETANARDRARAGLPADWTAGDKPGTSGAWPGMGSIHADIGFAEPPGRAPLAFAAYHRAEQAYRGKNSASIDALRQVGQLIATWAAG